MIPILCSTDPAAERQLFRGRQFAQGEAERAARRIVQDVRRHGDRALLRLTRRFDGVNLGRAGFTVSRREIKRAYVRVPKGLASALKVASGNIRRAAVRQLPREWRISNGPGVTVGQIVRPLQRVVCYVPGGRFPLMSTVLMSVIPAQVAGVREVLITSPRPAPAVLVAADLLGVEKIFRLGGAQAIAAFAYGTDKVPRADKIVGPGNRYVAAAKKLVAGDCPIEFAAGPTELMIVGSRGNPKWIAAELVAQGEHDPDAAAIFITPSRRLAMQVQAAVEVLLRRIFPSRGSVAARSLTNHGGIILTRDLEEAVEIVNRYAPEHLTLLAGATTLVGRIQSAGSVFLGDLSAVAAGDYASGSNHILPTAGAARTRAGLSAADFVKMISYQRLNRKGLARLRRPIVTLARAEGLEAHAESVETRFKG
jgi:histidinol dehydrogenase